MLCQVIFLTFLLKLNINFLTILINCKDFDPLTNKIKYQASSPDELALVEGGAALGYCFLNRSSNEVSIKIWDREPENWITHVEFPFDSSRKRMSVIVEHKNKYYLMTKGADSIMLPRCQAREETIEILQDHLNKFAKEGLRTLVMGQKEISLGEFQNFKKEFDSIKISNDKNKEKNLSNCMTKWKAI